MGLFIYVGELVGVRQGRRLDAPCARTAVRPARLGSDRSGLGLGLRLGYWVLGLGEGP